MSLVLLLISMLVDSFYIIYHSNSDSLCWRSLLGWSTALHTSTISYIVKIVKQHQCNANDIYGRFFLLSLVQKLLCISVQFELHGQNSWLHNVFVYICRLVNNQHKCRNSCANLKALELSILVSCMQPNMLYPRDVDMIII